MPTHGRCPRSRAGAPPWRPELHAACRTRRAERRLVSLKYEAAINDSSLRYLNRLSDLLFVMARYLNREAGVDDVLWQQDKNA